MVTVAFLKRNFFVFWVNDGILHFKYPITKSDNMFQWIKEIPV